MKLLPTMAAEAYAGRLSTEHLRAMGDCAHRHPGLAADHEHVFVEQAATLGAEGFRLATRHWLEHATAVAATEPPTAAIEVSRLHVSRTFEGWLRIDGFLAPLDAALVEAALDAGVDRALRDARDGDPSVEGQPTSVMRAGALVDLAAQAMRHEPSDASVPDRYRVAVIVRAGEPTNPAEAACDAPTYRVALTAEGEVLDVGRQPRAGRSGSAGPSRCVTGAASSPGATGPHHGPTSTTANHGTTAATRQWTTVCCLCRRHHTFVHRRRWRITIDNARPTARRPDGMPYTIRRWQIDSRAS